ncbi:MAG: NnrS family protein [Verrucomicrobiales bacterium]
MSPRCRFAKTSRKQVSICAEPFRLFFPVGVVASVIGVSLWPLLYAGWVGFYPAEAHARLMIEGFVSAFAIGFLGTAFPKMTGSPPLGKVEVCILLAAQVGSIVSHSLDHTAAGDAFFVFLWLFMIGILGIRLCFFRRNLPPPGFVLAGMGVMAGVCGAILLLIGRIVQLSDFQRSLGDLLLNEAFILGPILGIGGFLFPRFFTAGADLGRSAKSWEQRAGLAALVGVAVLASYVVQAGGLLKWSPIFRGVLVTVYLLSQVGVFRRGALSGSLSLLLRSAVLFLLVGILISGLFSMALPDVKHVLLIGGYGLLILTIASRVVWGHSGNIDFAEGRRRSVLIVLSLIILAMATRVVAGFIPTIRVSHHIYAALLWIIGVAIWSSAVLRYVWVADPDDD